MRLINADELIAEIAKIKGNLNTKNVGEAIKRVPTVEPERKGKWIELKDGWSVCSACNRYSIPAGDEYDFNYCPGCGAEMR